MTSLFDTKIHVGKRRTLWNVPSQRPRSSIPTAQPWRLSWPGGGLAQFQGEGGCISGLWLGWSSWLILVCYPQSTPGFAFTCTLPRQGPHQSKKGSSWFRQRSCGRARGRGSKAAVGEADSGLDSGPLPLQVRGSTVTCVISPGWQRWGSPPGWGRGAGAAHTHSTEGGPLANRAEGSSSFSRKHLKGFELKSPAYHGNCEMRNVQ